MFEISILVRLSEKRELAYYYFMPIQRYNLTLRNTPITPKETRRTLSHISKGR